MTTDREDVFVEHELSEDCDYCGKRYPGSIIRAQGPCARCMSTHGAEVEQC